MKNLGKQLAVKTEACPSCRSGVRPDAEALSDQRRSVWKYELLSLEAFSVFVESDTAG